MAWPSNDARFGDTPKRALFKGGWVMSSYTHGNLQQYLGLSLDGRYPAIFVCTMWQLLLDEHFISPSSLSKYAMQSEMKSMTLCDEQTECFEFDRLGAGIHVLLKACLWSLCWRAGFYATTSCTKFLLCVLITILILKYVEYQYLSLNEIFSIAVLYLVFSCPAFSALWNTLQSFVMLKTLNISNVANQMIERKRLTLL